EMIENKPFTMDGGELYLLAGIAYCDETVSPLIARDGTLCYVSFSLGCLYVVTGKKDLAEGCRKTSSPSNRNV
uniref:hypothetical protein n=1 Tax=Acinetobacter baumannii TaxID=470 RepID=UPI001C07377D